MSLRRLVVAVLALTPVPVLAVAGQPAAVASRCSRAATDPAGAARRVVHTPGAPPCSGLAGTPCGCPQDGSRWCARGVAGCCTSTTSGAGPCRRDPSRGCSAGSPPTCPPPRVRPCCCSCTGSPRCVRRRRGAPSCRGPIGGAAYGWRVAGCSAFGRARCGTPTTSRGARRCCRGWARRATRAVLGHEDADMHDVGMVASRSSIAAWRRLCDPDGDSAWCRRLRASILRSAGTLRALIATNTAAGTLPTRSTESARRARTGRRTRSSTRS